MPFIANSYPFTFLKSTLPTGSFLHSVFRNANHVALLFHSFTFLAEFKWDNLLLSRSEPGSCYLECGRWTNIASPESLLEMQSLSPIPDLLMQNQHLTSSPKESCAHKSFRSTGLDPTFTQQVCIEPVQGLQ